MTKALAVPTSNANTEVVLVFRPAGGWNKLPGLVLRRQFGFQFSWGMPHLI